MSSDPVRIGILISGRGSNMQKLIEVQKRQKWTAEIALVLSNRPSAPGLNKAKELGIPTAVLDQRTFGKDKRDAFDAALAKHLLDARVSWVVLAGFMRILGPRFVTPFTGKILNIHPSLLPRHKGLKTHERVLEAGDTEHGCTVHLVDLSLDGGPILAQARVPVLPEDTVDRLAARVLEQEHRIYPEVVRAAVEGRLYDAFPPQVLNPAVSEAQT